MNIYAHSRNVPALFRFVLAFSATIFALTFVFLSFRSLDWPVIHDNALMLFIAKSIKDGTVPYLGLFDFNLPATYFVHWILASLFDNNLFLAYRILDIFLLLLISSVIAGAHAQKGKNGILLFAISLLFGIQILFDGPSRAFQRDTWIALGLALFYLRMTLDLQEESTNDRTPIWVALLEVVPVLTLGFLTLVKPSIIVLGFVLIWTSATIKQRIIRGAIFLVPNLLIVAWIFSLGGLVGFIDVASNYIFPLYTRIKSDVFQPLSLALALIKRLLKTQFMYVAAMTAIGILYNLIVVRSRNILPTIVCLAFGIWHVALQNRASIYHFYPLYLAMIISIVYLVNQLLNNTRLNYYYLGILGALLLFQHYGIANNVVSEIQQDWRSLPAYENALSYSSIINDIADPNEPIMIFDTVDGLATALLYTGHPLCGRFLYDLVFFHDTENPYMKSLHNELLETVEGKKCRIIIVSEESWGAQEYVKTTERIKHISGLESILQAYYSQIETSLGVVYVLKD